MSKNVSSQYIPFVPLIIIFMMLLPASDVSSQSKEDVHQFFERQAAILNADRMNHSTREAEVVRVHYDRSKSTLAMHYKIDLSLTKNKLSNKDEMTLMRATLVNAACSGKLAPFIRSRNIRLSHTYYEKVSFRELAKFEITKRDC